MLSKYLKVRAAGGPRRRRQLGRRVAARPQPPPPPQFFQKAAANVRDNVGEEVDPEQLVQETCRSCLEQVGAGGGSAPSAERSIPSQQLCRESGGAAAAVPRLASLSVGRAERAGQPMLPLPTTAVGKRGRAGAAAEPGALAPVGGSGVGWDFLLSRLAFVLVAQTLSRSGCTFASRRLRKRCAAAPRERSCRGALGQMHRRGGRWQVPLRSRNPWVTPLSLPAGQAAVLRRQKDCPQVAPRAGGTKGESCCPQRLREVTGQSREEEREGRARAAVLAASWLSVHTGGGRAGGERGLQGEETPRAAAARCSPLLLSETGGSASPCALALSALGAAKERPRRRALLIPRPFLFQRARQVDEELNRRGSPVPKKVGGIPAEGVLGLLVPGHSHSVSACECAGSSWDASEVLALAPGSFSARGEKSGVPGRGGVTRRCSRPAPLRH